MRARLKLEVGIEDWSRLPRSGYERLRGSWKAAGRGVDANVDRFELKTGRSDISSSRDVAGWRESCRIGPLKL